METKRYEKFAKEKLGFFSEKYSTTTAVKSKAKGIDYKDLAKYRDWYKEELADLKQILKESARDREFWLFGYYLARTLAYYHKGHCGKEDPRAIKYKKLSTKFKDIYKNNEFAFKKKEPTIKDKMTYRSYLRDQFFDLILDIVNSFRNPAKLRKGIDYYNVDRLHWTFTRLTLSKGLSELQKTKFVNQVDNFLGKLTGSDRHTDMPGIIAKLETVSGLFNFLSVAFFAVRWAINMGFILRHIFRPTKYEQNMSRSRRFGYETWDKHPDLLNEAWAPVNFSTNYQSLSGLGALQADLVTVVFLAFDFFMILWRLGLSHYMYREKKKQYEYELATLREKPVPLLPEDQKLINVIEAQLKELEHRWKVNTSTMLFQMLAAQLLVVGYSASLLVPTVALAGCYALCVVAIGIYLSADAFSKYQDKKLRYEETKKNAMKNPVNCDVKTFLDRRQERKDAGWNLVKTMTKNTVTSALMIVVYAFSWEAALVLSVAYGLYSWYKSYGEYKKTQPKDEPKEEKGCLLGFGA